MVYASLYCFVLPKMKARKVPIFINPDGDEKNITMWTNLSLWLSLLNQLPWKTSSTTYSRFLTRGPTNMASIGVLPK